jgi:TonB-linked SusC/RagA family outer membrane protein
MDPTLNYRNPDGTYPISFSQPGMFPSPNYYLVLTQRVNPLKATTILSNAFAEYKILNGLQYKFSFNVDMNNTVRRGFTPSTAQGGLGVAPPGAPTGSYNTSTYLSWLAENTLTYQKSINGDHNFEALVGYSAQNTNTENSNINGTEFPDDNIQWLTAATTRLGNVGTTDYGLLSYIGRFNYNFRSKYLLSLAYRRDGSSRFGRNNQWGNFPSVSVGWIVSDESFLKNHRHINFLKLRASYGRVGNDNIGEYTHLSSVANSDYVFNNQVVPGRSLAGIGNAALTWESSSSYNLGLDLDLLKGRISFTYDYYWKKTDGLLYGIDIPRQSGFGSITSNIGRFDFWGHEFSVSSRNLNRGKLKWNTSFNISFDRNTVKALGTNNTPIGGYDAYWDPNRTAVGQPIGMFFGYVFDGIYMTQQELDSQPHEAGAMVGTARYKDVSGPNGKPDGIIDANDRTFIGNPNPTFIYGITNILSYGAFDLNVVMAGTVGNDIIDDALLWSESPDGIFNVRKGLAGRWRSLENPGEGRYPRTRTGTTGNFYYTSTRQVFKGTYLAVKNITLGYTLPTLQIKGVTKARVFVSAQNAFMFTKYPGLNPEVGIAGLNGLNQGRDFSSYPVPRVLTFGVNVGF